MGRPFTGLCQREAHSRLPCAVEEGGEGDHRKDLVEPATGIKGGVVLVEVSQRRRQCGHGGGDQHIIVAKERSHCSVDEVAGALRCQEVERRGAATMLDAAERDCLKHLWPQLDAKHRSKADGTACREAVQRGS